MNAPARGLFITGTDTGVGKTVVACAIVAVLRARGLRVAVYKPVETGCEATANGLRAADVERLLAATDGSQPRETACSYRFALPAAPLVAAEHAGQRIDPPRLLGDFTTLARNHDFVVVEGAGGLLVPIADGFTYLDLARSLGLPVLCVIGSRLGCINHTLLTLHACVTAGLEVTGFCTNVLAPGADALREARSNRETIARFAGRADVGLFPYLDERTRADARALARAADRHLVIEALLGDGEA